MRSTTTWSRAAVLLVALVLQACGGSGGGGSETPPTPVPTTLSVSTAATAEAGVAQAFASSATAAPGLRFDWAFGDGTVSSEAAPTHAYVNGGDYDVTLRISNSAGQSREATARVSVNRVAHLQGLRCTGANQGGWCRTAPVEAGNDALDVSFVDSTHGWAAGTRGIIRHTSDGGQTWQEQDSGTTSYLSQIHFQDRQRGWVFSDSTRTLLRTIDGGRIWETLVSPFGADFFGNAELDLLDNGALLLTWTRSFRFPPVTLVTTYVSTDGGSTWVTSAAGTPHRSRGGKLWVNNTASADQTGVLLSTNLGVSFDRVLQTRFRPQAAQLTVFDEQSVLVHFRTGDPQSPDPLERSAYADLTRDGGATWTRFNPVGLPESITSETVALDETGWLVSRNGFGGESHSTRDHGRTWLQLTRPRSAGSAEASCHLRAVASPMLACVDGFGYETRQIWLSGDRGETWGAIATPKPDGMTGSFTALSSSTLVVSVSTTHLVEWWITRDRGQQWSPLLPPNQEPSVVFGHWAVTAQTLLRTVAGAFGYQLQRSSDSGRTWQRVVTPSNVGSRFQFVSERVGWMSGSSVARTTDGGATWTDLYLTPSGEIWFLNEQRGWAFSYGPLQVSDDGGQTWRSTETPGAPTPVAQQCTASAVRFFDSSDGVVVSPRADAALLITRDGGRSCTPATPPLPLSGITIAVVGDRTVWVLNHDGGIAKSEDRGSSWQVLNPAPALPAGRSWRALQLLDADNAWIAADGGHMAVTRDGGRTWQMQRTPITGSIDEIQFVDRRTGWIRGDFLVFGTGTGGK